MAEFDAILEAEPKNGMPEAVRLDELDEAIKVHEANDDLAD